MSGQRKGPVTRRTPIDELRQRVKKKLGYCPTCGQTRNLNSREAAQSVGLTHTTLWRFLNGDSPSAETINALAAWLGISWSGEKP